MDKGVSSRFAITVLFAASLSLAVSLTLCHFGAHSLEGFLSMAVGLPGVLVSIWTSPEEDNYLVMALVNWVVYFVLIQALTILYCAVKRRLSR